MGAVVLVLLGLLGCEKEPAVKLQIQCDNNDPEACYQLGLAEMSVARPDINKGRQFYSKACMSTHHPLACNELATMVRDAKGGPKDLPRAAELFDIACKGEVIEACVDLGLLLYEGAAGIKAEPERAVELLTARCETDEPIARACKALGRAYEEGEGVERKDLRKAEELYRSSCEAQHPEGCVAAGKLVADRKSRSAYEEAADLYGKACTLDARHGCFELAELHREGRWSEASDKDAAKFFQRTCNIDPTRGCFEAAQMMEEGKVAAREGEIESLYNLACEHGHTEACSKRSLQ